MNELAFVHNVVDLVHRMPVLDQVVNILVMVSVPFLVVWVFWFGFHKIRHAIWAGLVLLDVSLLVWITKVIVGRERPLVDPQQILVTAYDPYSFPSWHSAAYMSLAVLTWHYDRRSGYAAFVLALLIGASRIATGVHFLTDVVAGWVAGALVSWVWIWYEKKVTTKPKKAIVSIADRGFHPLQ